MALESTDGSIFRGDGRCDGHPCYPPCRRTHTSPPGGACAEFTTGRAGPVVEPSGFGEPEGCPSSILRAAPQSKPAPLCRAESPQWRAAGDGRSSTGRPPFLSDRYSAAAELNARRTEVA